MNLITRFRYWLQTDPKALIKLSFIVGSALFVFLLILLVYSVNNAKPTTVNTVQNNSNVVTQESFENAKELERVDGEPLGIASQVQFIPGGKVATLNQNTALRIDKQNISDSPLFVPRQIYSMNEGIIINEDYRTTLYLNSGRFVVLPDNITQVTPFLVADELGLDYKPGFVFLSRNKNQVSINQAESYTLDQNLRVLARISANPTFKVSELRVINNQIYLVFYENLTDEGMVEIWKLNGSVFQKIQSLGKIQSIKFGPKQVLFTKINETKATLGVYETTLIDFTNKPAGETKVIDLTPRLIQNNILGNLIARRCTISQNGQIICLVKETRAPVSSSRDRDIIVTYESGSDKLNIPYKSLTFSADSIFSAPNNDIYIVGQENRLLYKIKN